MGSVVWEEVWEGVDGYALTHSFTQSMQMEHSQGGWFRTIGWSVWQDVRREVRGGVLVGEGVGHSHTYSLIHSE